jgi:hypothetical protein
MELDQECPICYDTLNESEYITECKHKFDLKCILLWVNTAQSGLCPICRGKLNVEQIRIKYAQVYINKNTNEKVTVSDFLKLPGVREFRGNILLNLNCDSWVDNFRKLMVLHTTEKLSSSLKYSKCSSMLQSTILVGKMPIMFMTTWMGFHRGTGAKMKLQLDSVTYPQFNKIDRVMQQVINNKMGNMQVDGVAFASPSVSALNGKFIECELSDQTGIFKGSKPYEIDYRSINEGVARFVLLPKFVVDNWNMVVSVSLHCMQMEIQ